MYICIYVYVYLHIHISTWLRPSPPPLVKGWFDHMEANYYSFASHRRPKIMKKCNKTDANSGTIHDKSVFGRISVRTWGVAGSQKATDTNKIPGKCEMVNPL